MGKNGLPSRPSDYLTVYDTDGGGYQVKRGTREEVGIIVDYVDTEYVKLSLSVSISRLILGQQCDQLQQEACGSLPRAFHF
jgi:hypothetical protein